MTAANGSSDANGTDSPMPAVITTPRLALRPFTLADVPKVFAMSQEAGMRRFIPDQVYRDLEQAVEVVNFLMAHTAERPRPTTHPYVLGVVERTTGELIGHVGLSPARDSVEIGYAVERRFQGQGLATEAVAAAAGWALSDLGLAEVLGIVEPENAMSCRVLEKAGFVRIGEDTLSTAAGPRTRLLYRRQDAGALHAGADHP
jgi:ribosomal-protein-alanine N-acetyltransferase